jgi:hypothetical protein
MEKPKVSFLFLSVMERPVNIMICNLSDVVIEVRVICKLLITNGASFNLFLFYILLIVIYLGIYI